MPRVYLAEAGSWKLELGRRQNEAMQGEGEYGNRIQVHYEEMWGAAAARLKLSAGPVHELPAEFQVLVFPPSSSRPMWAYGTSCMSTPGDLRGLELHMFSADRQDTLVELLTATAHYHRTGMQLKVGDSVNFGRPWLPGSKASFGLVSLPFLDGPLLEWLPIARSRIQFLWLIPITEAEVEFKKRFGVEMLEERLEKAGFNYLDSRRASVV